MPHYKGEQWVVARRIKGSPQEDNFKISAEDVPDLRKGEILCRALFISIDPITRSVQTNQPRIAVTELIFLRKYSIKNYQRSHHKIKSTQ